VLLLVVQGSGEWSIERVVGDCFLRRRRAFGRHVPVMLGDGTCARPRWSPSTSAHSGSATRYAPQNSPPPQNSPQKSPPDTRPLRARHDLAHVTRRPRAAWRARAGAHALLRSEPEGSGDWIGSGRVSCCNFDHLPVGRDPAALIVLAAPAPAALGPGLRWAPVSELERCERVKGVGRAAGVWCCVDREPCSCRRSAGRSLPVREAPWVISAFFAEHFSGTAARRGTERGSGGGPNAATPGSWAERSSRDAVETERGACGF
jgi:hypothetical protein